jgi:D-serine deaminase-like pyridoxal phosphate-dependent protein
MSPWKAAAPGDPVTAIDTPALVLDLDAFERNMTRMAEALRDSGVRLRAHGKSHKTPTIALRQIAAGAVGICCQKVSEAAVFVAAGVDDVLVTNQLIGDTKLHHLADLARQARMGVLVDDVRQLPALLATMRSENVTVDVYIEVNVGTNRCGVTPGADAVDLARHIVAGAPHLRFMGLHCYHGAAQRVRAPQDRATAVAAATAIASATRAAIEASGIAVEIVTGAGTGSFVHERDSGVFNEVQAGSYIFMDRDYGDNISGVNDVAFEHALFVRTTVMSRVSPDRAIVDAGHKASSIDAGMPSVWQRPDLNYVRASDDHGVIATDAAAALSLGDQLMLIPGNCDPTVNLFDDIVCVRAGHVEALWPVAARGTLL